jgi:pyruvate/2-oxoglutarate/acetoin dehydrogenase E1 component
MSYKDALIEMNQMLSNDPRTRFVGYGLVKGRALGTLKNVGESQIVEMPVAENLMVGFSIGLSLTGLLPVVFIERMDFLVNAMDALVNHLDKIHQISRAEFRPKVIIRCIVGNRNKPLYTGMTHTQDFSDALASLVAIPVFKIKTEEDVYKFYQAAFKSQDSSIIVEYKDLV